MVVGIMAVVAQARRKMISARTKAALQAAKARGQKLGGVRYRKDGSVVKLDSEQIAQGRAVRTAKAAARAADLAPIIADIKAAGASSLREIAAELNGRGIPWAAAPEFQVSFIKSSVLLVYIFRPSWTEPFFPSLVKLAMVLANYFDLRSSHFFLARGCKQL